MEIVDLCRCASQKQPEKKPSFECFYEQNYSKIFHYICGKIKNSHDAEDLTSEVFIYCYQHYEDYDPQKSSLATWLYLIVNSRVKNFYRDKHDFDDISEMENTLADDNLGPEKSAFLQELRDRLSDAIQTLPQRQQEIVILSYFKGKSSREIAERLGISEGNVRVLLSRSLDKLEALCADLNI